MKFVAFFIIICVQGALFGQSQFGQSLHGLIPGEEMGFSIDMPDPQTIGIGSKGYVIPGVSYTGGARVYEWNGISWIQKGDDFIGNENSDNFGYSISLPSSNTVAISAEGANTFDGYVKVFDWNGSNWIQRGADLTPDVSGGFYGSSISMPSEDILAIGSMYNSESSAGAGMVQVMEWDGSNWQPRGSKIYGVSSGDRAGVNVSMPDINTLAVSSYLNDDNGPSSGHVRIFRWNGSDWVQKGLNINGVNANDNSGYGLSMPDSNTVAIGSHTNSNINGVNAGMTRIFRWDGSNWIQKGTSILGNNTEDRSGFAISMADSNHILIGAFNSNLESFASGRADLYKWTGTDWIQLGLTLTGENENDHFGDAVFMVDQNTIAISASFSDESQHNAGTVKTYKLSGIQGTLFNDLNNNCLKDENEPALSNKTATIHPGNYFIETDANGVWFLDSLPIGSYTIVADSNEWYSNCQGPFEFDITSNDEFTFAPPIGLTTNIICALPETSIYAPFIRRCFDNQVVYVQAKNSVHATEILGNSFLDVKLDSLVSVQSASMSYSIPEENTYRFATGDLSPGEELNIQLNTLVSCDATLNQTFCFESNLLPVPSCAMDSISTPPLINLSPSVSCESDWDSSYLTITEACFGDSVLFEVTNSGNDMSCYSPYWISIDGQLYEFDSLKLQSNESIQFKLFATGQTYTFNVEQHPLHPGNSHPFSYVELCGDQNNWTPNIINQFPQNDADDFVDIYCGLVSGSYDPNDKTGYPLGQTEENYINPNQSLQYVIRFQNTGTDTAFTVVIRDTLDENLNIFSVLSGVSSHDYSFRRYGPRVLEWTFHNILLPDSTTDLEGSNGFVTFTVDQKLNLPIGTELTNEADIYFDFNEPIITNTTIHRIYEGFPEHASLNPTTINDYKISLYPNPNSGGFYIQCEEYLSNKFRILDNLGRTIYLSELSGKTTPVSLKQINSGIYFIEIESIGTKRFVKN